MASRTPKPAVAVAAAPAVAPAAAAASSRPAVIAPHMMAAAPMALLHQPLPPIVIAMPHRGATAATGIEALGDNLDCYAQELAGPSVDRLAAIQLLSRHDLTPKPKSVEGQRAQLKQLEEERQAHWRRSNPGPFVSNAADLQSECPPWYPGNRVENVLDPTENLALRHLLTTPVEASQLYLDGANITSLFQKLYAHDSTAAASADRYLQAYTLDVPQMRQRTINAEQALHESNLRGKSLAEQILLGGLQRTLPMGAPATLGIKPAPLADNEARELDVLRRQRDALIPILKQVREALVCPICTEVALLPKVLGSCGHVACQSCLKQLDDVAFATLTSSAGGASARQHLMARRCPLCRTEIIGGGFPIHPLKELASALVTSQLIEPSDTADPSAMSANSTQRLLEFKNLTFEKETPEAKHIHALQMGCYAQSQLAQHSVGGIVVAVTTEQWVNGVYVLFEAAVSRVFFETFATTLHGKAGGVNVLVNSAQRMLAVQLADRNKQRKPADTHVLIRVATDGRFTIGQTPEPKEEAKPQLPPMAGAAAIGGSVRPMNTTN